MTTWKEYLGDHPNPYDLPPALATALEGYDLEHAEPTAFEPARFAVILGDVLARATASVVAFGPPAYHNGRHFVEVVANARQLIEAQTVPDAIRQALLFAAAGHDFAHPGATFRKDAQRGVPLPDLGEGIATEAVSALLVNALAEEYGFNPAARLFIARSIGATTFGNPDIGPRSPLEAILVCADVAPNDTFLVWYAKGVDVTFHERPAKPAPTTFSGWIDNRLGFINYYLVSFFDPAKPQYVDAAVRLGWGDTLASYRTTLQRVKEGGIDPELTAICRAMLPVGCVDLDA